MSVRRNVQSDKLEFDPKKHEYKINGIVVPSVTQILKETGFYSYGHVNQEVLQRAANFGSAVHYAAKLDDEDNLGVCQDAIIPYLEGWRKFKKDFGAQFSIIEEHLYSKKRMFAGTPDRLLALNGALIDIKTGQKEGWHSVQLAGYEVLIKEINPEFKIKKRWTVYLKPDEYKIIAYSGWEESIFLSALAIVHWKRNKNIKGEE